MLSISHQLHLQRSHKLRANLFQEEKGLFKNTKIRRLSEKDAWFFYTRKYTKPIDFRQGRQTFGNTKLTNRHLFLGRKNAHFKHLVPENNIQNKSQLIMLYILIGPKSSKPMVSQLLIEWTSDWQGHQLSCPRKIKIICICKVFWDKRKRIEERENRLRLKERCQTCAALVPELSNKSTKWKYIKQKYKRQIYFSTQFCTILVVTLHSWIHQA